MRDCVFVPDYRAINVGDRIRWTYDEGSCTGFNHKIETYGDSAVTFESSPNCPSAQSSSSDCMNRSAPLAPKKETYEVTFSRQGSYVVRYYCPFHGTVSQGGTECAGMCGIIQVRGSQTSPTGTATSRSPTPSSTVSKSASPKPTVSGTVTVTPTTTVSPTASGTATVLAETEEPGGGGGGRGFIALAAIAALASAGFLVWRVFLASR